MKQLRLGKQIIKYSSGPYNKVRGSSQAIRITEGCPHNCPWCYEPKEIKIFGIPEIVRNNVLIYDMNLLCKSEALNIINELGSKRVNGKVVYYNMVCGFDYRFLTQEIADALHKNRFRKICIAWDLELKEQYKIKDSINMLRNAGYKPNRIMVFIIYNHQITTLKENLIKLDLCKIWNVQVADCRYDNQTKTFIPKAWLVPEMKEFRSKCRKHNQLVNFQIDPEV